MKISPSTSKSPCTNASPMARSEGGSSIRPRAPGLRMTSVNRGVVPFGARNPRPYWPSRTPKRDRRSRAARLSGEARLLARPD